MVDDVPGVPPLVLQASGGAEPEPNQVNLFRRLTDWRTLLSFGIAIAILAVAVKKSGVRVSDLLNALSKVNPWLYLLAFVVYYLSFPLRTYRWRMLMENATTGTERALLDRARFKDLLEILYLSWFANCVVPAKLGDVYRAYLTRVSVRLSASRTVGTILAERVLDMLILFPMLFIAALLTFKNQLLADTTMRNVLLAALVLGLLAGLLVVLIWVFGERLRRLLPARVHNIFTAFREGAIHSLRRHQIVLLILTVAIWSCEGGRLYLVLLSLGMIEPGRLGPSAALFLALGSSVLTTVPFAPGGLGLVETFLIAAFRVLRHHSTGGQAAALALLDRVISYLSIVVIGFFLYIFSSKTRAVLQTRSKTQPVRTAEPRGSLVQDPSGTQS